MPIIRVLGVLTGRGFTAATEHAEFGITQARTGPKITAINHVTRENVELQLSAGAMAHEGASGGQGRNRLALTVDGVAGSVASSAVEAARAAGAGIGAGAGAGGTSVSAFLSGNSTLATQAVELLATSRDGADYLLAARPWGSGISVFGLSAAGEAVAVAALGDTDETYLRGVSALASARIGEAVLVFAGSQAEHGISVLRLEAGGNLRAVEALGKDQLVPVQEVTALRSLAAGGANWLIASASGSSSLTVFRVLDNGRLVVTDHVIDTRDSRFGAVRCLEVVTVGERVFVLAAGADDGLSLFALTPDGRLVHVETIEDTAAAALSNVTALKAVTLGDTVQVLALSGAEAGLTVMQLDFGNLGAVIAGGSGVLTGTARADLMRASATVTEVQGGAGDDILLDGPGSQRLTGGPGRDIFVMAADGVPDTITDFDPAQDRIDLSAWPMFRGATQLGIATTATGAILTFGAERLEIITAKGKPLTEAQVRAMSFGAEAMHLDVVPGKPAPPAPASGGPRTVHGTADPDLLTGSAKGDVLYGHDGDDTLWGGTGADSLYGGDGFDIASWQGLDAGIVLDLGNPVRSSPEIRDDLLDSIEGYRGTAFGDSMTGGPGPDWLEGWGGNDTLAGRGGNDSLYGGDGNDLITAEGGGNLLSGGPGNDTLRAGPGGDLLSGGPGSDLLVGGAGNDTIEVGWGDRAMGGAGKDVFVLVNDAAGPVLLPPVPDFLLL